MDYTNRKDPRDLYHATTQSIFNHREYALALLPCRQEIMVATRARHQMLLRLFLLKYLA